MREELWIVERSEGELHRGWWGGLCEYLDHAFVSSRKKTSVRTDLDVSYWLVHLHTFKCR